MNEDPNLVGNTIPPDREELTGRDIFRAVMISLLVFMGIMILAYIALAGYYALEYVDGGGEPDPDSITSWAEDNIEIPMEFIKVLNIFVYGSFFVPVWLFLRKKRFDPPLHFRFRKVPGAFYIYALIIGPCVAVLGDEMSRLLDMVYPMPNDLIDAIIEALTLRNTFDYVTIGFTVFLLGPVVEEALFRGFLQRWLEHNKGVTSGVLVASAVFAAVHFNIYQVIPILLMATILGAMTWRTESIWPAVIVHSVNNGLGLIAANTTGKEDPGWYSLGEHVAPWWIILAIVIMVWSLRRYFRLAERLGIGGHGPKGDSGTHVNMSA